MQKDKIIEIIKNQIGSNGEKGWPENGKELEKYTGKTAYELRDKIASATSLDTGHAIYLGTELAAAEIALKNHRSFEQDTTFKI
jgi:dihydropteroate synthase